MSDRRILPGGRSWITLLLLAVFAACGDMEEPSDGTTEGAVDGVSSEEMVGQATPMSLEEAESLGIVDTTVSVGPPVGPDSQPAMQSAPPR